MKWKVISSYDTPKVNIPDDSRLQCISILRTIKEVKYWLKCSLPYHFRLEGKSAENE
jgi:hypothetical protein